MDLDELDRLHAAIVRKAAEVRETFVPDMVLSELETTPEQIYLLRLAMADLPERIIQELSSGAWPEPHCGVCRSLDLAFTPMGKLKWSHWHCADAIDYLGVWHGERMTHKSYNPVTYRRCLYVYELARDLLVSDPEPVADAGNGSGL